MSDILVDSNGERVTMSCGGYYIVPHIWGGSEHTPQWPKDSDGQSIIFKHTSFKMHILPSGIIYGSGSDEHGKFSVSGAMLGDEIQFSKSYEYVALGGYFVGKRIPGPISKICQFSGVWGQAEDEKKERQWVITGVVGDEDQHSLKHPAEGEWGGHFLDNRFLDKVISMPSDNMSPITMSIKAAGVYKLGEPFDFVGNGNDKVGTFSVKGTAKEDGTFEMIKTYTDNGNGWKYQGVYDGDETIGGIWGPIGGGKAGGTFTFTKKGSGPTKPVPGRNIIQSALTEADSAAHQGGAIIGNTIGTIKKGLHF
ncbi:hypothetical protein CVT24_006632 [Panaeolus cyanescens]|uniref:Uncharacterized protein n=1 Tax=Panaeolus cyanescens TaxID=181874 RepID=A0A409YSA2_9AGAR|nr:hypothetical protein CVT24_006632 [Panaeolus cyanescens]